MIVKQDTRGQEQIQRARALLVQKGWCKKDKGEDVTSGESEVLG